MVIFHCLLTWTIAGESARINMHTDHQPAVFSMPGTLLNLFMHSCLIYFFILDYSITNLPGGASFKASICS